MRVPAATLWIGFWAMSSPCESMLELFSLPLYVSLFHGLFFLLPRKAVDQVLATNEKWFLRPLFLIELFELLQYRFLSLLIVRVRSKERRPRQVFGNGCFACFLLEEFRQFARVVSSGIRPGDAVSVGISFVFRSKWTSPHLGHVRVRIHERITTIR